MLCGRHCGVLTTCLACLNSRHPKGATRPPSTSSKTRPNRERAKKSSLLALGGSGVAAVRPASLLVRSFQEALQEQLAASHSAPAWKSNIDAHQKKICPRPGHQIRRQVGARWQWGERWQHLLRLELESCGTPNISSHPSQTGSRGDVVEAAFPPRQTLLRLFSALVAARPRISSSCWL